MSGNKSPLVSVILTTYNRVKELPRALNSVLLQTYSNIEVLVIDDCSTDDTEEYMIFLSSVDRRVRYIKNMDNLGPSAARNKGARLAKGEVIAFQDDDDEWPQDKLEKQMKILLNDLSVKMVYCGIVIYNGSDTVRMIPSSKMPIAQKRGDIFRYLLLEPLIGTPTMVMWKKEFWEAGGFDENIKSLEDYEFSVRFALKYKIGFADDVFLKVYDSPDSVNKRLGEKIRTQMLIVKSMFWHLKNADLLWDKLVRIKKEAANYDCLDVFYDLMEEIFPLLKAEDEKRYQVLMLDDAQRERQENELKLLWFNNLQKIYLNFTQYADTWKEGEDAAALQIARTMQEGAGLFRMGKVWKEQERYLDAILNAGQLALEEKTSVFLQLQEALKILIKEVSEQLFQCNVCCENVFFKSDTNFHCPVCGASENDRLIIAFLDELESENGDKLKMLQITSSPAIEKYASERTDILKSDARFCPMDMEADSTYDILIYSEYNENISVSMKEWYRIIKPDGILIVNGICKVQDSFREIKEAGFIINELNMEYFGTEFYAAHGFHEDAVLLIASKYDIFAGEKG